MKIGIIGTRGIPNRYGGFEQFAEYIAPLLVQKGHEVTVYNSSLHPYQENEWHGVKIVRRQDAERRIGTAGQFLYDFNCIMHCRKSKYDIILQLGYTSSSIWSFLFPSRSCVITNMDGLEWKRSKYSNAVKLFLKYAEKIAATKSTALIADSPGIQDYLKTRYSKESYYIAYGAEVFSGNDSTALSQFQIEPFGYYMILARAEPENNVEVIIRGYLRSRTKQPLLIIGNFNNTYGLRLQNMYGGNSVRFMNAVYDITLLNQLRCFSLLYFHGHSVGGTNPSLLEAMASGALIAAHDNIFNRAVIGNNAFYFANETEVSQILNKTVPPDVRNSFTQMNKEKISTFYNWNKIAQQVEDCFFDVLEKRK